LHSARLSPISKHCRSFQKDKKNMYRTERGVKRICATCEARFYDLGHAPIHCPKCEAVFVPPEPPPPRQNRMRRPVAAPAPLPLAAESSAPEEEDKAAEADDVLLLDEADEEAPDVVPDEVAEAGDDR
jgi:uncharacterized protein (TIGR02300 family)